MQQLHQKWNYKSIIINTAVSNYNIIIILLVKLSGGYALSIFCTTVKYQLLDLDFAKAQV